MHATPGGASQGLASLLRPNRPLPHVPFAVLPLRQSSNAAVALIAARSGPVASFPLLLFLRVVAWTNPDTDSVLLLALAVNRETSGLMRAP
jgi:hypothetical protein